MTGTRAAVLTFTPNPSIDVGASTERITPEHKLRCTDLHRDPGGGGVNVARVLQRLGTDCLALFPAGGAMGRLLQHRLDEEAVPAIVLEIGGETRESFTVLERTSGREFRFVLPGPRLTEPEWQAGLDRVESLLDAFPWVVASGSLPEGVPNDYYARLAAVVHRRGGRIAVDASGPALAAALEAGVDLVKPNLRELRELTGEALEHEVDWARAAEELVRSGGAGIVALSLGAHGALIAAAGETIRAHALEVPIAGTVGAGDSFLAAVVWCLNGGRSLDDALRHGVAAGTAALLSPGTRLALRDDVLRLAADVRTKRLQGNVR
ncbi:MAG TPA: 1-phosphofructokinase family hexose kinase [Zeimonas sp.]|nr:1-phosphofructokinase family hexose kinase [Zeimonas sp.]